MGERVEGWGNLSNTRQAHYFRAKESLCRRWLALSGVYWESNQSRGKKADSGTCATCWRKAPENAPETGGVSA